jgi:hypothetical protein
VDRRCSRRSCGSFAFWGAGVLLSTAMGESSEYSTVRHEGLVRWGQGAKVRNSTCVKASGLRGSLRAGVSHFGGLGRQ